MIKKEEVKDGVKDEEYPDDDNASDDKGKDDENDDIVKWKDAGLKVIR